MGAGSLSTRQEHTHGRRVAVLVTSGRGARASCPRHMRAHAAPETTSAGHKDRSFLQAQSLMAQQDAMIFTFLPLEFQRLGQVPRSDPLASSLKVQSALGAAEYEATNVTVIWLWSRACSPQGRGLRASTDPNAGQGGWSRPSPQGTGAPGAVATGAASSVVPKALSYPRRPRSSPLPGPSETLALMSARGGSLRHGPRSDTPSASLPPPRRPGSATPLGARGPRRARLQLLENLVGRPAFPLRHGDVWLLLQLGAVGGTALPFDF